MTIRTILQGDIPALRTVSTKVTSFDTKLTSLLTDLGDTLEAHRGLGLSAPQIGVNERVFVMDLGEGTLEFVNPEMIESSGEVCGFESCLSFPEHTLQITRPQSIKIQAQDRLGQWFLMDASDLLARIFCHELDHLNGILFMDYLSVEELFSQILGNSFTLDNEDKASDELDVNPEGSGESGTDEDDGETMSNAEKLARQQELQLSIDMLSELTWKLTLSLEILRDYGEVFAETIAWARLEEMTEVMDSTIEVVEAYMKSLDTESDTLASD